MTKNLKLSYILIAVASAILMAWRTLYNFFGGVGLNFVALVIISTVLLIIVLTDKFAFNRIKDLFIITCAFVVLELITYFGFEFVAIPAKGIFVYQNILSIFGLLFFCYIAFRFILEFKGIKIGFVEFLLGNARPAKKPKKAIELTNGTLEEKPNKLKETESTYSVEQNETITQEEHVFADVEIEEKTEE